MRCGTSFSLLLSLLCGCSSEYDRLRQNTDSLRITIGLHPFDTYMPNQKDPGGGLRAVLLYTSGTLLREPHAEWPDGSPVSADAQLTEQEMLGVLGELERSGLLEKAEQYYSEAVANPNFRPPTGKPNRTYNEVRPSCIIRVTYTSNDYHRSLVCTVPWGKDTLALLEKFQEHIPKSIAGDIIRTCERFRKSAKLRAAATPATGRAFSSGMARWSVAGSAEFGPWAAEAPAWLRCSKKCPTPRGSGSASERSLS